MLSYHDNYQEKTNDREHILPLNNFNQQNKVLYYNNLNFQPYNNQNHIPYNNNNLIFQPYNNHNHVPYNNNNQYQT